MIPISIEPSKVGILLIDVQSLFYEYLHKESFPESVTSRIEHLLILAAWAQLPTIATFEDPVEKKGWLSERLDSVFPAHGQRFIKHTYNCCSEPEILTAIQQMSVQQIAIAGAETDVCVLQSVLGLLRLGYQVFLLEDCLYTCEKNTNPAINRMYQAGAIPSTYKTFAYELTQSIDYTPWSPSWIDRDKSAPLPERFIHPEELPS